MNWLALIPIIILSVLFFGMTYFVTKIMSWQKFLTLNKYLEQYPDNKTANGVKCNSCGSEDIKEKGLWGNESRERSFICSGCNNTVYRSES